MGRWVKRTEWTADNQPDSQDLDALCKYLGETTRNNSKTGWCHVIIRDSDGVVTHGPHYRGYGTVEPPRGITWKTEATV